MVPTFNLTGGVDFKPLDSVVLTVPADSEVLSVECTQFTVLGDDQREFDESFTISFTPITNDNIVGETVVTVIIEDDNDSE